MDKAMQIYITHNENQFEFIMKASLGIARCLHNEAAGSFAKRSISISKTFSVISRKE